MLDSSNLTVKKVWRPMKDRKNEEKEDHAILRLRDLVNKISADKFKILSQKIIETKIEKESIMNDFASLVFDKMVSESEFRHLYLQLLGLIKNKIVDDKTNLDEPMTFKSAFVEKCQQEFVKSLTKAPNPEMDQEEEYKCKMYVRGTSQMLGLIFKEGFLPPRILKIYCLDKILESASLDHKRYALENFCHLLQNLLVVNDETILDLSSKEDYSSKLSSILETLKPQGGHIVFQIEKTITLLTNAPIHVSPIKETTVIESKQEPVTQVKQKRVFTINKSKNHKYK